MNNFATSLASGDLTRSADILMEAKVSFPLSHPTMVLVMELEEKLRTPSRDYKLSNLELRAQRVSLPMNRVSSDERLANELAQFIRSRLDFLRILRDLIQPLVSEPGVNKGRLPFHDLDWRATESVANLVPNFRSDLTSSERTWVELIFVHHSGCVGILPALRDLCRASIDRRDPLAALAAVARGRQAIDQHAALTSCLDRVTPCKIFKALRDSFWHVWGRASVTFGALFFSSPARVPNALRCEVQLSEIMAAHKTPAVEKQAVSSSGGFFSRFFSAKKSVEVAAPPQPQIDLPPPDSHFGQSMFPELATRGCLDIACAIHRILALRAKDVKEFIFMVYLKSSENNERSFFDSHFSLCHDFIGERRRGGVQEYIQCFAQCGYQTPPIAQKHELLDPMAIFFATSLAADDSVTRSVQNTHQHVFFLEQTPLESNRVFFVLAAVVPEIASSAAATRQSLPALTESPVVRTDREQHDHANQFKETTRQQLERDIFECFGQLANKLQFNDDALRSLWTCVA